ncbi:mitochondrial 37S ribosomal protein bS16m KNAG_0D02560 [Huiozyma naganishii CBS 8797]|uniref:Ribosomal protein S16 n=1 Tax=Huiozyma naganishii (strain ATCC MYA-139 / BCRC 22969 / CBS 8797 / KCTC 17520 / NBRC 10181 / NCYC 3082 / Yp74L-3) TaxID=1071383 RepID=J7R598_HUIN7|nr:hypothetical protein KNAG_0D02560 [Kazachstania naganishii CBS 8797]CCK70005.1 hypothetical protein KNAG_0D02560 [Kazachstania naganishii CBS 8797]
MTCGLVRIRLARFGRRNNPLYNIVVTQSHKARDSRPIEVLGTYNPTPKRVSNSAVPIKEVNLDFTRAKYWIGVGAQPSDIVTRLFIKGGILPREDWASSKVRTSKVVSPLKELME